MEHKVKEQKNVSEFARMHPIVNFTYIVAVMVITMITLNPIILLLAFTMSTSYGCMAEGMTFLKRNLLIQIPVLIFTVLIQPLFSRSGTTALFYINDNAVTLEGYVYGLVISILLISIMQWSSCMRIMFTSEKFMYLFGRIIPSLGLIFSMILRFVPLLRDRYRQISEAQDGMGRKIEQIGLMGKARQFIKELSILISWSLESSIETSISMEARGYGLKGRTSYSRYILNKSDIAMAAYILCLFVIAVAGIITGKVQMFYLPRIYMEHLTVGSYVTVGAFALLGCLPLIYDLINNVDVTRKRYSNEKVI